MLDAKPLSNIFIQENTFPNVVCKLASILSRPQCAMAAITQKAGG